MKATILYFGFGDECSSVGSRYYSPAGQDLSLFTLELLRSSHKVEYIDCGAQLSTNKWVHFLFLNLKILYLLAKKSGGRQCCVFYHSFAILPAISLAKFCGAKLFAQINEVYSNTPEYNAWLFRSLERKLLRGFSFYILSSELLAENLGIDRNLNFCVLPGPIRIDKNFQETIFINKKTIKLVYIGIIDDKSKSGAFDAIEFFHNISRYQCQLDIYGFGNESSIDLLKSKLTSNVRFMGALAPNELDGVLGNYDIGLALQDTDAAFSASSYPSKVLKYLSAGLPVIASPTPAILKDNINDSISLLHDFCEADTCIDVCISSRRSDRMSALELYLNQVKKCLFKAINNGF